MWKSPQRPSRKPTANQAAIALWPNFGDIQILEHEAKLYPENERFTRERLEEIFEKYQK